MVPRLVAEPSPQSITAVKSDAGSLVLASVNLPTSELVKSKPVFAAGVNVTPVTAVSGLLTIVAGLPAVGPAVGKMTDTVEPPTLAEIVPPEKATELVTVNVPGTE